MAFKCLLIKPCSINHLSYNDSNYIKDILGLMEEITFDQTDFINSVGKYLDVSKFVNKNIDIKNNIFEEEPNFIYDIMFINNISNKKIENSDQNEELVNNDQRDKIENNDQNDKIENSDQNKELVNNDQHDKLVNNDQHDKLENNNQRDKLENNDQHDKLENNDLNKELENNEIAMLLNKEDIIIKGNVIIFKEFVPSLSKETLFYDMLKDDLERLLLNRKYKSVVTWDDINMKWQERKIIDLSYFIKDFFDNEQPEIKHIEFLMHNIHIFYIQSPYGNKYACGKLLSDISIEKCLIITMISDDIVGSISLDEVKKMIKLSEKIDRYVIPCEFLEDDITSNGRAIKNTKYKILDKVYNKYY